MDSELFPMVLPQTVASDTVEKMHKTIAALEKNGELIRFLEK